MIIRVHPSNLFTATKIHRTWRTFADRLPASPRFRATKYVIPSDHEPIADPVVQWLYFFRDASNCTAEELARRLPDPIFEEATGVLEMIAKNPEERQHYEDRLKAERDEWARTAQAKLEGIEQGQRNERARTVKMLRDIVGELTPSDEKLADLSLDELAAIETERQRRRRDRTG